MKREKGSAASQMYSKCDGWVGSLSYASSAHLTSVLAHCTKDFLEFFLRHSFILAPSTLEPSEL